MRLGASVSPRGAVRAEVLGPARLHRRQSPSDHAYRVARIYVYHWSSSPPRGHVAIVTGGATNLGRAAAAEFARCGADVVIADRNADALEAAAAEIGPRCTWVSGDIREVADCERIVGVALDRHGRVDTLLNNAGGEHYAAADVSTPEGWAAVQRLNTDGTQQMTHACVERALRTGGGGMIASVAVSARHGLTATVDELTREWAQRWQEDGISAVALALDCRDPEQRGRTAELVGGVGRPAPLGRLGEPHEFGWLAALVASPLGRSLSGTTITLDGAAGDWWGPWPLVALANETVTVSADQRRSI
ncbi:SDR family oxidoreductase [soil metagenome]